MSLTAQQPLNNIVRTAIEALAGVLGGTQSLHTNSYDEALALPTEDAVQIALRTQQIIAHETGVANTIDPLGGSYFVEALTDELERQALAYFARIDELGGMVAGGQGQLPAARDRRRLLRAPAARSTRAGASSSASTATGSRTRPPLPILRIDPTLERKQIGRLQAVRAAARRAGRWSTPWASSAKVPRTDVNLMPSLLDAARVHATEGEIVQALQRVWGDYTESPVF